MDKTQKNKLGGLLEDGAGGTSSMRFGFLLTIIIVMLGWGYISYKKTELQTLPDNVLMLVLGFAGIKAGQRFVEVKDRELSPDDSTTEKPKQTLLNG